MPDMPYGPLAFYFEVMVDGVLGGLFQEVSGISSEMEIDEIAEGGENRYKHRLPKGVKLPDLVLKGGSVPIDSPLIDWCRSRLEEGFIQSIEPKRVVVNLLDGNATAIRSWSFESAYPVKWEVNGFHSTKDKIAVEQIVLSYSSSGRTP
ncbi:MAG: phage tail protein [Acidobacteriota bacterium]